MHGQPRDTRHHRLQPRQLARLVACAASALVLAMAVASPSFAAGARKGVHPAPGEIVLLRAVPTRPAVRQAPPGLALLVDTKPNAQLDGALGTMELSDREASSLSAPITRATNLITDTLGTRPAIAGPHGGDVQSTPRGTAANTTPLSVVGNVTRGVGSTITGALQALPLGKPAGG